ncbi:hypothetical protein BC833DRAFT_606671 [Globomyces pollinis-pini]|nr:hypothetical protein BC833DRAFT_606671 [Globomyces pollinis-pini]
MWAEKLWGICVKVDTYSSLAHKKPFVIHEDFHSHKLLPNEFVDWSLVPLDELIALGKKDSLLFGHNLETIRILRKIAYFDSISDTIQSKLEKKIIATNLHCMILRMLESTPQSQKHFNTLEEFVAKDLQLPIVGVAEPITTKLFIICMVNLHRSLLKQGIHLNFALSLSTPNNPIPSNSFTSQDILLLSLRAFKYLVSIRGEEGDCQAPYFNIDESTRIMDSFMNSVKACMAYQIADLVLSGFSIQPIQKLYLLETVDIVKFSIFPAVSMHGWKWPVASYFAAKIQASIRRANASTGLLTF